MEELEFEEKRVKVSDHVTAAQGVLAAQTAVLSTIQQARRLFEAGSSSAAALADLTIKQCRACIDAYIESGAARGSSNDDDNDALSSEVAADVEALIERMRKVVHVLRVKGERALLLQCLQVGLEKRSRFAYYTAYVCYLLLSPLTHTAIVPLE